MEKLDDVELEAPSTQDEEVRLSRLLDGEWGIRLLDLQSVTRIITGFGEHLWMLLVASMVTSTIF